MRLATADARLKPRAPSEAGGAAAVLPRRDRRSRQHGQRSRRAPSAQPSAPSAQPPEPDQLHLRRRHAATPRDAEALRVREDRRRLRLQVRLLHHPDAAGAHTGAGPRNPSCARRSALAARGVRELLLISQDTTFYGIDRQERGALARLLRQLNAIDGLEWIRLLYLYPTTIDDETLAAMAECDKVCNYIDLPLQHASNPVLKRMKRPGTRKGYDTLLNTDSHSRPRRRPSHDVHRRLSRRNERRRRRTLRVRVRSRI